MAVKMAKSGGEMARIWGILILLERSAGVTAANILKHVAEYKYLAIRRFFLASGCKFAAGGGTD